MHSSPAHQDTVPLSPASSSGLLLLGGVFCAALAEAMAGTSMSYARFGIIGDLYTSPDEFAWLDIAYITAKFAGFMLVPWFFTQKRPATCLHLAVLALALSAAAFLASTALPLLICLRAIQGLAGGLIMVGGQSIFFRSFPIAHQPYIQAFFAVGGMVAPGMFTPAIQGFMLESMSWHWIFIGTALLAAVSGLLLSFLPDGYLEKDPARPLDIKGFTLFAMACFCLTYVSQQGSRWNWLDTNHITLCIVAGFASLTAFILHHKKDAPNLFINKTVFNNLDSRFGFLVSIIAGSILFCTNALIASYMMMVLGFSPSHAGLTYIPSGLAFMAAMFVAATLIYRKTVPVLVNIPLGLILVATSLWLFAGSNSQSSTQSLMPALLLRGTGLGFLFLAMTIFALNGLKGLLNTQGVALFSTIRQAGGMFFVALLQWYLDQQNAANRLILSSSLNDGSPALAERLQNTANLLYIQGMERADATKMAMKALKQALEVQTITISLDNAFMMMIAGLLCAVPFIASYKIYLSKKSQGQKP